MDQTALQELISQVRGSVALLAETEQKIAALKAEFAQKESPQSALSTTPGPMPNRDRSGREFVIVPANCNAAAAPPATRTSLALPEPS